MIHLDGRTLEGGGQLVRNAVALSALTGQPITINHIRENRPGKKGLKGSHTAAVKFLAEVSGAEVMGANIGSTSVTFLPQCVASPEDDQTGIPVKPEYNIRLATAGSVFLIFQALYPYFLHAGTHAASKPIRVNITGGTNVSFSPSYDYVAQVLIPNFAMLSLPPLSVHLHKRGWSTGPVDLGAVTLLIDPLDSCRNETTSTSKDRTSPEENRFGQIQTLHFPSINLNALDRGKITKIDITILAPDLPLPGTQRSAAEIAERNKENRRNPSPRKSPPPVFGERPPNRQPETNQKISPHDDDDDDDDDDHHLGEPNTVRKFMEEETCKYLRRRLKTLPKTVFSLNPSSLDMSNDPDFIVPTNIHTSEPSHHRTRLYVLIVAHTSTGVRIARDALHGAEKGSENAEGKPRSSGGARKKGKSHSSSSSSSSSQDGSGMGAIVKSLVERCVDAFVEEISSDETPSPSPSRYEESGSGKKKKKPCFDEHMRDQVVVFEALGKLSRTGGEDFNAKDDEEEEEEEEDERYWSLHTRTAKWVCEQMLGTS